MIPPLHLSIRSEVLLGVPSDLDARRLEALHHAALAGRAADELRSLAGWGSPAETRDLVVAAFTGDGLRLLVEGDPPVWLRLPDGSWAGLDELEGSSAPFAWGTPRRDVTGLRLEIDGSRIDWTPAAAPAGAQGRAGGAFPDRSVDDAVTGDLIELDRVESSGVTAGRDRRTGRTGDGAEGLPVAVGPDPTVRPADLARPGLERLSTSGLDERPGPERTVPAVRCAAGHLNPPTRRRCRDCDRDLTDSEVLDVPRPVFARLVFDSGEIVDMTESLVIGRRPTAPAGAAEHRRLLSLASPDGALSRDHVVVHVEGWRLLVEDVGSLNGTEIVSTDGARHRLRDDDPVAVAPGTRVVLAGVNGFVIEALSAT